MSKIEELIKKHCPDGVEYKQLWEITYWDKKFNAVDNYKQPKVIKYHYFLANDLKPLIVDGGNVKILTTSTSNLYTTQELADGYISEGEIVSIPWGGNPNVQYYKGKFITGDNRIATAANPDELNNKYLYYCLKNKQEEIGSFYRGAGIKHPSMSKVLDISIPLPPLPVQEEIVRILDNFTTLEAELEAELDCRKRQYEYYRDKLLNVDCRMNNVEWKKLGEVASFKYGYTTRAESEGDVRIIRITDISEQGRLNPDNGKFIPRTMEIEPYLLKKGDLVMARTGATYGKTLYFNEDYPSVFASFLIKITLDKTINPRYYWHFSKSTIYWNQAKRLVGGGAQPQFNTGAISQVIIPIPPLAVQERIVNVLDNFEQLCNDLGIGLPAEIEARQKQYEYYRNKLLSFTPPPK